MINPELLEQVPLFEGIAGDELTELLGCLEPVSRSFAKNELVYSQGDDIDQVCIVLSGSVRIIKEDFAGNMDVIAIAPANEIVGLNFVLSGAKSDIYVRAAQSCDLLFIARDRLITPVCGCHGRLISNLLRIMSAKCAAAEEKLHIISRRTTREKLLAYFYIHAERAGSARFSIPLNRAQLAEYLGVDRSAMSRELCSMRDEGILEFYKNAFILTELS